MSISPPVNFFIVSGKKNPKTPNASPTFLPTMNPLAAPIAVPMPGKALPINAPSPANIPPTEKETVFTKALNSAN